MNIEHRRKITTAFLNNDVTIEEQLDDHSFELYKLSYETLYQMHNRMYELINRYIGLNFFLMTAIGYCFVNEKTYYLLILSITGLFWSKITEKEYSFWSSIILNKVIIIGKMEEKLPYRLLNAETIATFIENTMKTSKYKELWNNFITDEILLLFSIAYFIFTIHALCSI